MKNSIVLITDNEDIAPKIEDKILLLRDNDSFERIPSINCFENIKNIKPVTIFYHLTIEQTENNDEIDKFLNFIQKLRQTDELKTTSIILLFDQINEEVLSSAFEYGINDFLQTNSTPSEFTIRTIWGLQKKEKTAEEKNTKDILSQLKILDKNNNVYTENYTFTILKKESKKNWGTFVTIAPDINIRNQLSPQVLMKSIKKIIRTSDILGYATDFKIYLWFSATKKENVEKILQKIRENLAPDFSISAGYIETKNIPFDTAEEIANRALAKALLKGNTFIYATEEDKKIPKVEERTINFKHHKKNLTKKITSILTPLFYQIQKIQEEKLFETKITQKVTEEESIFRLENTKGKSFVNINYSGFTKINIEIIHNIKEKDLKAEKLFIEAENFSEKKIENILNNFIKEFKTLTNN